MKADTIVKRGEILKIVDVENQYNKIEIQLTNAGEFWVRINKC